MLTIKFTAQFKKDAKRIAKRKEDRNAINGVVEILMNEKPLPEKYKDHQLTESRDYKACRECHVKPDLLLIYSVEQEVKILRLIRTGSHSDLF